MSVCTGISLSLGSQDSIFSRQKEITSPSKSSEPEIGTRGKRFLQTVSGAEVGKARPEAKKKEEGRASAKLGRGRENGLQKREKANDLLHVTERREEGGERARAQR
ncbi:hypothetical protein NL676_019716 [Syzygium grande]|nr:hypothetical protein NL676_019716 [Syzygium grande]